MKRGKKGQFYLVATIIIVSVIIGFALYQNSIRTGKGNEIVYDLGRDLKIETGNVYDYGTYNSQETESLITQWVETYYNYSKYQGTIENWVFIYGNSERMTALTFSTVDAGSVSIYTGSTSISVNLRKEIQAPPQYIDDAEIEVNIRFKEIPYLFNLEEGENFFFIISSNSSATTS